VGRGILHRANHADVPGRLRGREKPRLAIPFEFPVSPLNRLTLSAFNNAYYVKNRLARRRRVVHYDSFFFPLDGVERWNRIYGRRGLLQFQCAVPPAAAREALRAILGKVAQAGDGSFLAVLKNFGDLPSPGLLSFPRQGTTVALDFPNRGEKTARLFGELHAVVRDHGGALYPAKDAQMSAEQFHVQFAEHLPLFRRRMDPACSSSFWRRVA
jgi:FAD/FMN-containing dehydrogenase